MSFPQLSNEQRDEFAEILSTLRKEREQNKVQYEYEFHLKRCPSFAAIEQAAPEYRVDFLIHCIDLIRGWQPKKWFVFNKKGVNSVNNYCAAHLAVAQALLRKTLPMREQDVVRILAAFFDDNGLSEQQAAWYPLKYFLNQVKKQFPNPSEMLSGSLKNAAERYAVFMPHIYDQKIANANLAALADMVGGATEAKFAGQDDAFARYANPQLAALSAQQQAAWGNILALACTATAGKPSEKFLKEMKTRVDELGADSFKAMLLDWLAFICRTPYLDADKQNYALCEINQTPFKGLIWACSLYPDREILRQIAEFALYAYTKEAGIGARYAALGNACFYALYRADGLDGIAQLSRLRLRIKFSNAQTAIAKYLDTIASERGVSRNEIEDMAVDDFGLQNGSRDYVLGDYICRLVITGVGKSELQWFKPDGMPQKTVPSVVKTDFANVLKEIKANQKNLNTMLTAQRDRLDQMLRSEQRVSVAHAEQYYWQHGLMAYLTRPLIWQFFRDDADKDGISALWLDNQWVNESGESTDVSGCLNVSLFHPVLSNQQSIANWRNLLLANHIRQPMKQAYREIYLLTEAEINTKTYSNRFAAHILKQHQYMALAKLRGWKGSLAGAWDGGDDASVTLDLPEYGLRAEFWANAVDSENTWTESGIWLYASTDQVRFHHLDDHANALDLIDIPPRVFSEVLRDVDLFVGVASVGNDPTWQDNGGEARYYSYWQSYSFGDLSEVAKTRKAVLETLLPRLKIAKIAHIDGNFLVVQGKLRTYKIHIGSSNILMLPDDQYLCIVPNRKKEDVTDKLFIPFEGDNTLSVVLSKAMLLADDDKISDSTITSQIERK